MKTMRVFGMEVGIPTKGDKCPFCNGKGYIEVVNPYDKRLGNGEMKCCSCAGTGIYKQRTNFQRITESEEALAKVIMRIVTSSEAHGYNGYCLFDDFNFDEFMKNIKDYDEEVGTKTEYEHYKEVLMWLKQESTGNELEK